MAAAALGAAAEASWETMPPSQLTTVKPPLLPQAAAPAPGQLCGQRLEPPSRPTEGSAAPDATPPTSVEARRRFKLLLPAASSSSSVTAIRRRRGRVMEARQSNVASADILSGPWGRWLR